MTGATYQSINDTLTNSNVPRAKRDGRLGAVNWTPGWKTRKDKARKVCEVTLVKDRVWGDSKRQELAINGHNQRLLRLRKLVKALGGVEVGSCKFEVPVVG